MIAGPLLGSSQVMYLRQCPGVPPCSRRLRHQKPLPTHQIIISCKSCNADAPQRIVDTIVFVCAFKYVFKCTSDRSFHKFLADFLTEAHTTSYDYCKTIKCRIERSTCLCERKMALEAARTPGAVLVIHRERYTADGQPSTTHCNESSEGALDFHRPAIHPANPS